MAESKDSYLCSFYLRTLECCSHTEAIRLLSLNPFHKLLDGKTCSSSHKPHTLELSAMDTLSDLLSEFLDDLLMHGHNPPYKLILQSKTNRVDIFYNQSSCSKYWARFGTLPSEEVFTSFLQSAWQEKQLFCDRQNGKLTTRVAQELTLKSPKLQIEDVAVLVANPSFDCVAPTTLAENKSIASLSLSAILHRGDIMDVAETCLKLFAPPRKSLESSYMYLSDTLLVVDEAAARRNVHLFTYQFLKAHKIFRIHPEDYKRWNESEITEVDKETVSHSYSKRLHFRRTEVNPTISVSKKDIHWRGVLCKYETLQEQKFSFVADWYYVTFYDPLRYAKGSLPLEQVYHTANLLFPDTRFQAEHYDSLLANSWRQECAPSSKFVARIVVGDAAEEKKLVFSNPLGTTLAQRHKARVLQSFGLLESNDSFVETKFWLQMLKQSHAQTSSLQYIESSLLTKCFSGFSLESAKLLCSNDKQDRPKCSVCYTNTVNVMLDTCGHLFCESCIEQCIALEQQDAKCPSCRSNITLQNVIKIVKSSMRKRKPLLLCKEKQVHHLTRLSGSIALIVSYEEAKPIVMRWSQRADVQIINVQEQSTTLQALQPVKHLIFTSPMMEFQKEVHSILQLLVEQSTSVYVLTASHASALEEATVFLDEIAECYASSVKKLDALTIED